MEERVVFLFSFFLVGLHDVTPVRRIDTQREMDVKSEHSQEI